MRVAGFGFRKGAGVDSLLAALEAAGGSRGITRLATVSDKAETGSFHALAEELSLPTVSVPASALSSVTVATVSAKSEAMYGTGSLSEAVALVAAGPKAKLVAARAVSPDKMATCAIAEVTV